MDQLSTIKVLPKMPVKMILVSTGMLLLIGTINAGFVDNQDPAGKGTNQVSNKRDSIASVKAFMQAYEVLMSPRCVNCHPAGDVPLQGDDSHLHTMSPQRGPDGKGLYAMKCANCHQPANTPGVHTPPGDPNWHLPPADMKMVFEGRTPHQLAKQLTDSEQNGHKSMEQLMAHASDALVLSAWNPGEGRSLPPLSHEAFTKSWETWIKKGAYAPPPQ